MEHPSITRYHHTTTWHGEEVLLFVCETCGSCRNELQEVIEEECGERPLWFDYTPERLYNLGWILDFSITPSNSQAAFTVSRLH